MQIFEDAPKEVSEPVEGDFNKIIEFLSVFEHKAEVSEPAEGDINKIIEFLEIFSNGEYSGTVTNKVHDPRPKGFGPTVELEQPPKSGRACFWCQ